MLKKGNKKNNSVIKRKKLTEQIQLQAMVIPGIVLVMIFSYVPMWGVLMSFQNFDIMKGFFKSDWVGLANFKEFLTSRNFGMVMRNTIVISSLKLIIGFPMPIILALLLNEVRHAGLKKGIQTITYLPYFLSWVIVSGMIFSLFSGDNGAINTLLEKLNIIKEPINFMNEQKAFWPILILTNVWKDIGFSAIIYIAAIAGVNPEYYEAAEIDGAGRLAKILHVTIPSIAPQIIILLILAISNILNAGFEDIYNLTNNMKNGVLIPVAEVIDTHVYRMGVLSQRYSYATAVGLFKSLINIAMLVSANSISRKATDHSLW